MGCKVRRAVRGEAVQQSSRTDRSQLERLLSLIHRHLARPVALPHRRE